MIEKGIHSEHIYAERRSYFFQMKQSEDKSKYLLITECKISDGQKIEMQNIAVYEEDMDKFTDGLIKMLIMFQ
ncbi:MAG TPA: DUF3276 family protein [Bacteroidia bacterium]|nr:DUF3276 family protein [Bacteroidia bacterium]